MIFQVEEGINNTQFAASRQFSQQEQADDGNENGGRLKECKNLTIRGRAGESIKVIKLDLIGELSLIWKKLGQIISFISDLFYSDRSQLLGVFHLVSLLSHSQNSSGRLAGTLLQQLFVEGA